MPLAKMTGKTAASVGFAQTHQKAPELPRTPIRPPPARPDPRPTPEETEAFQAGGPSDPLPGNPRAKLCLPEQKSQNPGIKPDVGAFFGVLRTSKDGVQARESWRKGWDLNPRYGITVYRISSPAHSTSLPPFRNERGRIVADRAKKSRRGGKNFARPTVLPYFAWGRSTS